MMRRDEKLCRHLFTYEEPNDPELIVDIGALSLEDSVGEVIGLLHERGVTCEADIDNVYRCFPHLPRSTKAATHLLPCHFVKASYRQVRCSRFCIFQWRLRSGQCASNDQQLGGCHGGIAIKPVVFRAKLQPYSCTSFIKSGESCCGLLTLRLTG